MKRYFTLYCICGCTMYDYLKLGVFPSKHTNSFSYICYIVGILNLLQMYSLELNCFVFNNDITCNKMVLWT
jgi:hypothetical protein